MNALWRDVISLPVLDSAWEKVRANGGAAGGDGIGLARFQAGAARRLAGLSAALASGGYQPGPYRQVDIPKKKGGTRRLSIPSVVDRVAHTAVALAIGPVLDARFAEASFAYRPGRSVEQAVQAVARYRDAGYRHVAEADIVDFFGNVDHDRLLAKLAEALPEEEALRDLIALILVHQAQEMGRASARGLAQGSPLSPLLANLYLDALDERLERRGVKLVRFADDFILLAKRRARAEDAVEDARAALAEEGLELRADGTRVLDFDRGFECLGHLFVRDFALRQVGDPEEDPAGVLRELADQDARAAEVAEEAAREARAGHDRGARVLYVTEPGRRLRLRNFSFAVDNKDGKEIAAIAHGRVDRIEVGPGVAVEPEVVEHALSTETDFAFVARNGELRGLLGVPETERAELHLLQARAALDPARALPLVRALVDARIRNQRTQLFRLNRKPDDPEATRALVSMGRHLRKLPHAANVAAARGLEGVCAAEYWPALGRLTRGATRPLRRQRPARDPLNAAVNYLTALLLRDTRVAILSAGLHPGFGLLHASRDRAEAAVYDLMEPFRAPLTEGLAATLFNQRRLRPEMFDVSESGVRMSGAARRAVIAGYESALSRAVNVRGRKGKLAWRPMMRRQALDLAAALRRDDPTLFLPYLMEA